MKKGPITEDPFSFFILHSYSVLSDFTGLAIAALIA